MQARRLKERIILYLLAFCALAALVTLLLIALFTLKEGLPAFREIGLGKLLLGKVWRPQRGQFGLVPMIFGSVYVTIGALLLGVPPALGCAVFLAEVAPAGVRAAIRPAVELLAGIPSVVYGLFGLGLFVLFFRFGTSILAGSLTLGLLTLPVVISTAEEAILSVPQSFRVVSISLGATKWQTIRHQVLPHALPGIITGIILGLERAAGETAPILFTVAAFYLPRLPRSIFDQTMALPYHLYVISTQVPGMPIEIQYGTALVLLAFVLSMNSAATIIRSHFRRRRQW